jgi:putative FmdB family regulatory protein
MPLYEYRCEKCGRFETLQKFSEGPLVACPACGEPVERLISAPAFQFKGSGFYITDYARAGEKGSDSKESETKASESKPSEKAPESSSSKEASTPPSADLKSSTNSPPKESTAPAAKALAPAATPSQ